MAESIREVIARMKSNQQNSQTSKHTPAPKPAKVEVVEEAEDDYLDEEEMPEIEQKVAPKPVETEKVEANPQQMISPEQQIAMEIEMLQNDGRFRAELLHQLQEINKALVVVAGTLVDLAGKNDKA